MKSLSKKVLVGAIVLMAMSAATMPAQAAEDNHYAVFSVENKTNLTITYSVHWVRVGDYGGGVATPVTLKPGESMSHWWRFDFPNQNSAPEPHVGFACDLRPNKFDYKQTPVGAFCAPKGEFKYAKKYSFGVINDGKTLELFVEK